MNNQNYLFHTEVTTNKASNNKNIQFQILKSVNFEKFAKFVNY